MAKKFEKEWVDAYFENGIDIANRRVFIGDIDEVSVDYAIKGLYLMETNSHTEPIEMFISSFGGDVYEALALYDIMQTIKPPIHTFAYGKCMSAAPLILAAGEKGCRWIAPHCAFMHHDWAAEVEGKGQELTNVVKHYSVLEEQWTSLFASCTRKDARWWTTRAKKATDFYFTAEEALEWGVGDQFWVEKGNG